MNKPTLSQWAVYGSKGGRSGRGANKKRPAAHYRKIAKLGGIASGAARRAKANVNALQTNPNSKLAPHA